VTLTIGQTFVQVIPRSYDITVVKGSNEPPPTPTPEPTEVPSASPSPTP
jgi:hypothetical protein